MKDIRPDSIHWEMFKQNYLEMEKKQTINAYENGYDSHNNIIYSNGEEYYNKSYNQHSELPKEDKTFKRKSQWTEVDNMTKRLK